MSVSIDTAHNNIPAKVSGKFSSPIDFDLWTQVNYVYVQYYVTTIIMYTYSNLTYCNNHQP